MANKEKIIREALGAADRRDHEAFQANLADDVVVVNYGIDRLCGTDETVIE